MDDEEEFKPSPTEGSMTMGAYVRKIIRRANVFNLVRACDSLGLRRELAALEFDVLLEDAMADNFFCFVFRSAWFCAIYR